MPLDNSFDDAPRNRLERDSLRMRIRGKFYIGPGPYGEFSWLAHGVLTSNDWGLNRITGWKLKRCWFPRRCFLTGKKLWSKHAYYGVNWIHGPGETITEPYWVDSDEFIMWQLKK
tara:strand:+ start:952 stop:1296 length:345 start_codon:yes stop_codon:yes gene_type:complete